MSQGFGLSQDCKTLTVVISQKASALQAMPSVRIRAAFTARF